MDFTIDFSSPLGPVKPVNGVCNGPSKMTAKYFKKANIPFSRLPDMRTHFHACCDVPSIFRDFYADENDAKVVVRVNGRKVRSEVVNGFIPVRRGWKAGDRVELEIPMPVRYSVADERVEADRGRTCITRGPLVFCAEEPDNKEQVSSYVVDKIGQQGEVAPFTDGNMKGIPTITIDASNSPLKLIPYYSWNNRGDGTAMNVWFKTSNAE